MAKTNGIPRRQRLQNGSSRFGGQSSQQATRMIVLASGQNDDDDDDDEQPTILHSTHSSKRPSFIASVRSENKIGEPAWRLSLASTTVAGQEILARSNVTAALAAATVYCHAPQFVISPNVFFFSSLHHQLLQLLMLSMMMMSLLLLWLLLLLFCPLPPQSHWV
mmetsp:Transcript_8347/g.17910  ORF Transcript_8347/g.17910 Transcript_8347/m.17910 type:complete len:164 (-) Transcript_8347:815-1306(-)